MKGEAEMITKQCIACGGYFGGALDGEYLCAECRAAGAEPKRMLAALDTAAPGVDSGDGPRSKRQAA